MSEQSAGLAPGVSFYQVLEPTGVLSPEGLPSMKMMGPFPDLGSASQYAAKRVGAIITVTLCLFQTPPAALTPKAN